MTDGSVCGFGLVWLWFLRKIRPTQHWVELGCGNTAAVWMCPLSIALYNISSRKEIKFSLIFVVLMLTRSSLMSYIAFLFVS